MQYKNIFLNIYFPSIYAYLFVILIINIFTITNILKPKGEKVYKTINGVTLTLTNFILILILEILAKNKIEVFNKASIFSNPTLITLLELSINIFIIWLISLLSTYIINNITTRIILKRESRKLAPVPAVLENNIQELPPVLNPAYAFIPEETNKFIPNFTISTKDLEEYKELNNEVKEEVSIIENKILNDNTFDLSAFIPKKQVPEQLSIIEEKQSTSNDILDKILNNNIPYVKEEIKEDFTEVKNTYTLNDYRIFNKMLKDIKEHNGNNSVTIDKMMEYRLITKYSNEAYDMFKTMLKIYSNQQEANMIDTLIYLIPIILIILIVNIILYKKNINSSYKYLINGIILITLGLFINNYIETIKSIFNLKYLSVKFIPQRGEK